MTTNKNQSNRLRLSPATFVVALLVGIIMALPFKVISETGEDPLANETTEELISRITKLTEDNLELRTEIALPNESRQEILSRMTVLSDENEDLKTQLEENETSLSNLEQALMQDQEASAELQETLDRYRILAGLEPVRGPGVRLTLSEQPMEDGLVNDIDQYLIHQEDLLNIVNELWLAGAEAIAIRSGSQTERLVMWSTIRCVGSLIDINNSRMTPPFDIFAIGDPDDLYNAMTMRGGVLEPFQFFNIDVEIVKLEEIELPRYRGTTLMEHAEPLEEE